MRISYDAEVDALSIMFREATVTSQKVAEGVAFTPVWPENTHPPNTQSTCN